MGRRTQVPTKKSNLLYKLRQRGGNTRNNGNSADMGTPNKDTSGEIETFGAVLVLRYDRVDLKKYFDVFRKTS